MKYYNWAIIGTGRIAHTFAQALGGCEDAVLYAVGSRSEDKAKKFADEFGELSARENIIGAVTFIEEVNRGRIPGHGVFVSWTNTGENTKIHAASRLLEADAYSDSFTSFGNAYGEIIDGTVRYLDEKGVAHVSPIEVSARKVRTSYDNPNLKEIEEITSIRFEDENLYTPRFGLCGLAQDETAIATMMEGTYLYAKGLAESPYPLEEALQDAYTMILLLEAEETGKKVESVPQAWN